MLYRWLGQSAVCFGYLDSGRHVPITGINDTVGALVNTLVCRLDLDEAARLCDILEAVQDDYLRSLPHHSSALRALDVLELAPPSQHLFNTLINYRREQPNAVSEQAGIVFEFISGEDGMEVSLILGNSYCWSRFTIFQFDAVLNIDDVGTRLDLSIDYWDGRVPNAVAIQISLSFQTILAQVLGDLNQQVSCVQHSVEPKADHIVKLDLY
jgi:non-ribosomal peptide synthetase component F